MLSLSRSCSFKDINMIEILSLVGLLWMEATLQKEVTWKILFHINSFEKLGYIQIITVLYLWRRGLNGSSHFGGCFLVQLGHITLKYVLSCQQITYFDRIKNKLVGKVTWKWEILWSLVCPRTKGAKHSPKLSVTATSSGWEFGIWLGQSAFSLWVEHPRKKKEVEDWIWIQCSLSLPLSSSGHFSDFTLWFHIPSAKTQQRDVCMYVLENTICLMWSSVYSWQYTPN